MHSKVIIASLVCLFASSFNLGNKTVPNYAQKDEPIAKETVSRAPNDYQKSVWISEETGNAGRSFNASIDFEREYSNFGIIQKSPSLGVQCTSYGNYASVRITTPNSSGDYYVKFGYTENYRQVVLATIYVICSNGHYSASSLSKDDARANFYRNYVANSSELSYISGRDQFNFNGGNYTAYNPARYNAEKNYSDYISGGRDDVESWTAMTPKSGFGITTLVLHANWIDVNGVSHPLAGVRADFIKNNSLLGLGGGAHFTNNQGKYMVTLFGNNSSGSISSIKCRLASVCRATSVEDRFCQNYPICYSKSSSNSISNYSQIDYYIDVYAGTSDRADAYELTQIQTVPYSYASTFAQTLDTIITQFPAEHTDYHNFRHRDYTINVQKEDAGSWDVLNHEYGHYICDKIGLARISDYRHPHDVHSPLEDDYISFAYSEGLATYLGIASQMYNSSAYNIPGYADEIYSDSYRNLSVDYNQFKPASTVFLPRVLGERTESSVTSVLLKMLDNVARAGDDVAFGHLRMWNVLTSVSSASDPCDSIIDFINSAIALYPSYETSIRALKQKEGIADRTVPFSNIAAWTIMIYMDGCDLESGRKINGVWENPEPTGLGSDDIKEILGVNSKPDNVNIIIETGGAERWKDSRISSDKICRFEVIPSNDNDTDKRLKKVETLENDEMNKESTFESFLEWGISKYPAQKTGVVLWGHGGGLGSACGLGTNVVAKACHDAFDATGVSKLDFIFYDSCACAVQDAAEFNSPYFDYMVASQLGVPGRGSAYDQWIDNVYNLESVEDVTKEIAKTYVKAYEANLTASVLTLSHMAEYKTNFEIFASALKEAYPLADKSFLGSNKHCIRAFAESSKELGFNGVNSAPIDGLTFLRAVRDDAETEGTMNVGIIDAVIASYKKVAPGV